MNTRWIYRTLVYAVALTAGLLVAGSNEDAEARERLNLRFRVDCPAQVKGVRNIVSTHTGWSSDRLNAKSWRLQKLITGPNLPSEDEVLLICQYGWHDQGGEELALKRSVTARSCRQSGNGWTCIR